MVLYGSAIPASKRFFKISELAGKRWPTVTEDEIYNWHDAGYKNPIAAEGWPPLVDTTCPNRWNEEPHWGEINLMAYWVFFPEFYSLVGPTTADLIMKHFDEEAVAFIKREGGKLLKALNSQLLSNHFFMIGTDSAKGLAYNNHGSVDCIDFYNEQGFYCPPGMFDAKAGKFLLTSMTINKEDLLIKASSVQFLEQIAPELTSADRRSKDGGIFQDGRKAITPPVSAEENYAPANAGKPLEGWKAIAAHAECCISTAKNRYKKIIRRSESGRPFIMSAELDAYRNKNSTK